MGFIDFSTGDVLTANQMDTVLRQSVMRFADASARDTAIGTALAEGMLAYLDDTNEVLKYDGSSWIDISGDISAVTAGTALTGGGTSGNVTLDVDLTAITIPQSQVTDLTTDLAGKQEDVITTQGDLVIGDGSGDASRIAIGSADTVLTSNGTTATWAAAGGGGGFNTLDEITSSNATYDVSGISGFGRFTLVGAGGGGTRGDSSGGTGGTGGSTSVTYNATTITAAGGIGSIKSFVTYTPPTAFRASNNGSIYDSNNQAHSDRQNGGEVAVYYVDLTGLSTIDVTIGAGGVGADSGNGGAGDGADGVIWLEYAS